MDGRLGLWEVEEDDEVLWKCGGIKDWRNKGREVVCCQSMRAVIAPVVETNMLLGERSGWRMVARVRETELGRRRGQISR